MQEGDSVSLGSYIPLKHIFVAESRRRSRRRRRRRKMRGRGRRRKGREKKRGWERKRRKKKKSKNIAFFETRHLTSLTLSTVLTRES